MSKKTAMALVCAVSITIPTLSVAGIFKQDKPNYRLTLVAPALAESAILVAQADNRRRQGELPAIGRREGVRASLKALQRNGVLRRLGENASVSASGTPMFPLKHTIACEAVADCELASDWGRDNGFKSTPVLTTKGHGGESEFHIHLRKKSQASETAIHQQAVDIQAAMNEIAGAYYLTWMMDTDSRGNNDGERN